RDGAPLNELHLHMQHDAAGEGEKDGEIAARVNEAVQALPPKLRAAIMLTVYEELNHAEAAAAMGCAETTVSWRVFMARRRLKRALSRLLNNPPNPDGQ
ncbi:MAG TPA: hypothetical protein DCY13_18760, partial [Verrucomicrobiales bacterium]|nr:hypothetical protein [Verrucomicrobiales bacterium]